MRRLLLCNGDATALATWSNTPYFLLQAGLRHGLLQGGLPLQPQQLRHQRHCWNLAQMLRYGRPGGYQYSTQFNRALLAQACLPVSEPLALLSLFPFLPPQPWPKVWRIDFYIDATTLQVFRDYGCGQRLSQRFKAAVLARERQAYSCAGALITMCRWAADSLVADYGIDPSRVHVITGGANLDEAQLMQRPRPTPPPLPSLDQPLRLGFLGKDWQRKGGPFLLQLADALRQRGIPTVIRAIGPDPGLLPSHPALQPLGFVNKQTDMDCFANELQSWHFGTLFSEAEASPRSNLECLRLGVPLLSHAVGGIASTVPDSGCGQLFSAHPSASTVADWIAARLNPYSDYLAWRQRLAHRWHAFTWDQAVVEMAPLLN